MRLRVGGRFWGFMGAMGMRLIGWGLFMGCVAKRIVSLKVGVVVEEMRSRKQDNYYYQTLH
jgi:hypothetical protein